MKKTPKIILTNIFILCILLIIIEIICCVSKREFLSKPTIKHYVEMIKVQYSFNNKILDTRYRYIPYFKDTSEMNKKSPIILVGGSFTNGFGIEDNKTLDAQLKKETQRDTYNLGINGGGPREILITLKNEEITKRILKTPDYVIYTYIPDHKRRLYVPLAFLNANFKPIKNYNNLEYYIPFMPVYKSFIYETIMNQLYRNQIITNQQSSIFFDLYMKTINEEIKKQFGSKTKFAILIYYGKDTHNWETINKYGIKTIDINTLCNIDTQAIEYKGSDKEHPNAKAWEVIVPKLVEELKL